MAKNPNTKETVVINQPVGKDTYRKIKLYAITHDLKVHEAIDRVLLEGAKALSIK
jgi:hypothetical protein